MNLFSKTVLGGALPLMGLSVLFALPAAADDFPDGAGKVIILRSCGACHPTDQITRQRKSEADWQATVVRMAGRGAKITGDETDTIVKYLAANFLKLEDASKVNVNKATAKDLLPLGFTEAEAAAIIDYRSRHGDFRGWGDMLQIYGVDGEKCEAAQNKMSF
jgi:mono/diheme cytochrome c family protein